MGRRIFLCPHDSLATGSSGGPVAQQGPGGNCVPPPILPNHTRRVPPQFEPTGPQGFLSRDARTTSDASFIVFASDATNLEGANGKLQIYRFRQGAQSESGIITHVSKDAGGDPASADCVMPSISDDGMKIVFSTTAALLSSDTDPFEDVYLVDLSEPPPAITRVSAPRGSGDRGPSFGAAISGNGGFVAFTSEASDLVTSSDTVFPDANGTTSDVFRFNTATLAMDIVSVNNVTINNVPVQSTTPFSTIGDDPTRCSAPVGDLRVGGVISDDGSRILMHGTPCDWDNDPFSHWLCPDCENCCICDPSMGFPAFQQVYLRDMNLAATPPATFMVSRQVLVDPTNGDCEGLEPGNGCSRRASISGDGTRIAFSSFATNFRSDEDFDEDSFEEVFWIDTADVIAGVSPPPCKQPVRASIAACPPIDGDSFQPMLSSDGNWIAFASDAKTLLANPAPPPDDCPGPDTNGSRDVFVHDVGAQTTVRFSVDSAGVQGDDDSKNPDLTGDGRRVVYESLATNLLGVNNDMNDGQDIFESPAPQGPFIRGDANNSGTLNITDIVVINNWLFQGGSQPPCIDAADANDDGRVDVSDPDYLGVFLFQGGPQPPCPFCSSLSGTSCCGKDPTGDGLPCGQPLTGCTEFQSDGTCPTCQ